MIMKYIFFSVEAEHAVSYLLMENLNRIEKIILPLNPSDYCAEIDQIAIIPICIPDEMIMDGFGKERKMISHIKRFADIRLRIDYLSFLEATPDERNELCIKCIVDSIEIVGKRMKGKFDSKKLAADILSKIATGGQQ